MAQSTTLEKKKSVRKEFEKNAPVVSVNFYGALKSKNEIYFQMASLFKQVTQADTKQDEKKLKSQWMKQILIANSSDIHGKSFINNL